MNSKDLATGRAPAGSSDSPSTSRQGGDAVGGATAHTTAFDPHYEMASTYFKPRAVLLPKNPEWMFLHWDFDGQTQERLTAGGRAPQLRVLQNGREALRTSVDLDSRRFYIKVPDGGGSIQAQLGQDGTGEFVAVLTSGTVTAPAARVADDVSVQFVAPAWTGATPEQLRGSQMLTEEQYNSLFGEVPNDVPWYRIPKS